MTVAIKYKAIAEDALFNDDYPTGKFKVQAKAKPDGCPIVLKHKWDKGYNLTLSYKQPLCRGFKADGSFDITPKGALQPGCNVTHGNFWVTAKYNSNVEVGVKDSKVGPCTVGSTANVEFGKETKVTAHVQAAYAARLANSTRVGMGGKVKCDDKEVKPEMIVALNKSGMNASVKWETLKNVFTMHALLCGPVVFDYKTTFGTFVAATPQKVTNVGVALQLAQDYLKLKGKVEKLNTATPVPSISAMINHKPVEGGDAVELTFACEFKESQPKFGFQASF